MNDHEIQLLDFAELVQWLYCILTELKSMEWN